MNDISRITKAIHFATKQHAHQRRKGELQEPYVNHVTEVAYILTEATDGKDVNLIIAGLLHDTVEDTDTTHDDLVKEFGDDIANIVREVSDDKSLEKQERKHLQIINAPKKSDQAKMLKIADKISNLRSIINSPPVDWDDERKLKYFDWAKQVVTGCSGVNNSLDLLFTNTYNSIHN